MRTFMETAEDLKGVTEKKILDEIKRYRSERKKSPEVSVVALPKGKNGLRTW